MRLKQVSITREAEGVIVPRLDLADFRDAPGSVSTTDKFPLQIIHAGHDGDARATFILHGQRSLPRLDIDMNFEVFEFA